jgi:hypothetical protein
MACIAVPMGPMKVGRLTPFPPRPSCCTATTPADWNGYSNDVVYAGQVADDRLTGVTINGNLTDGIDASWGTALNTLPGSNAERDAPNTESSNSSSSGMVKSASAPPPLRQEDQPALAQDGYLWTPGYWYWRD